jgi:hypothetical protein
MTLAAETPPADEPPAPPRDPADYGRRKPLLGLGFWLMLALCLACALGGAAFSVFAPRLFGPRPQPQPQAPFVAIPPPTSSALAPIQLNPTPMDVAAASAEVAALQDRVSALEATQSRTAASAQAALAAGALIDASRASRPFVEEMVAVERLLPASAETRTLRRLAETGAPSRAVLADDFQAAAARAATAARAPTEGAGLFDQIAYAFASVIQVRRVNITSGNTPDAILAHAEQLVEDGDIDAALAALDGLPPRAREAMSTWRERAARRAEIDRSVAAIRAAALAGLQARP